MGIRISFFFFSAYKILKGKTKNKYFCLMQKDLFIFYGIWESIYRAPQLYQREFIPRFEKLWSTSSYFFIFYIYIYIYFFFFFFYFSKPIHVCLIQLFGSPVLWFISLEIREIVLKNSESKNVKLEVYRSCRKSYKISM